MDAGLRAAVERIVGPTRVSGAASDRIAHARDLWPRLLLGVAEGAAAPYPPDLVCWPESVDEVGRLLRAAADHGAPVVPFGAGSGVCGAAVPVRGGLVLDLKRMRRLRRFEPGDGLAEFEAGVLGETLERALERRGHTLGHFPSSLHISTLGGWIATRSAGQCSSKYGKIEDLVAGVEAVLASGALVRLGDAGRARRGPDLLEGLLGSEGTLAVITGATVRIQRAPEARLYRGWSFARLPAGLEAMRRLMQRGLRPAVLRLYDELDSALQRAGGRREGGERAGEPGALDGLAALLPAPARAAAPRVARELLAAALSRPRWVNAAARALAPRLGDGRCLMIVGFEGARARTEAEARLAAEELALAGGSDLGPGPGERWLRKRYDVSFKQSGVYAAGAFADTMEVASSWSGLLGLYEGVRRALAEHVLVMAHFSHAYPDGCSIYFSFVGPRPSRARAEQVYDAAWAQGLAAALAAGATMAHHHGVGLLKAPLLAQEHGDAVEVVRALKRAVDPRALLNPGKLGLDEPAGSGAP